MGILRVIVNKTGEEIEVSSKEVIEKIRHNKKYKSLLINGYYSPSKLDTIIFKCDETGEVVSQQYRFKARFFEEKIYKYSIEREKTCLKKYGVKNCFQSDEKKEKIKQTNIERYGFENPMQNMEVLEKTHNTQRKNNNGKLAWNNEKSKQTKNEFFGSEVMFKSEYFKEKSKQTLLENLGVENPTQSSEIQDKIKQTSVTKYGVDSIFKSEYFKDKFKQTSIAKYGFDYPAQSNKIKEKIKETWFNKFYHKLANSNRLNNLVKPLFKLEDYCGISKTYDWECCKCKTVFQESILNGYIPRCPTCFPKLCGTSLLEKEIGKYIKSLNILIEENTRKTISPLELDIYVPSHNLAIEFDGLYWHSELSVSKIAKTKHLYKTDLCEEKGIKLIHIFEDEWIEKQDIVKSIICSKLGIYQQTIGARKCQLKEINSKEASMFYEQNHLQGYLGSKINIGLFYENELVSCLSFSKSRYNKKYDWEITRFANKLNIKVVGSFAKLFSRFKSSYKGSIITYSDRRYFDGSIYKRNGFTELKDSSPSYYYTDYKHRYNRVEFQKHKLKDKLKDFDPNLTEWENMQLNGWDRIWDCGNKVFEFKAI